jgi:hypothetical protein
MPTIKELAESLETLTKEAEQWKAEYQKAQGEVEKVRGAMIDALHAQTGVAHVDVEPTSLMGPCYIGLPDDLSDEDPVDVSAIVKKYMKKPATNGTREGGWKQDRERKWRLFDYMKEKGGVLTTTEWAKAPVNSNPSRASADFCYLAKLNKIIKMKPGQYRLRRMPRVKNGQQKEE